MIIACGPRFCWHLAIADAKCPGSSQGPRRPASRGAVPIDGPASVVSWAGPGAMCSDATEALSADSRFA